MRIFRCAAASLFFALLCIPIGAQAITILGIDFDGGLYEISTETGGTVSLGSTGLPNATSLGRTSNGSLYSISTMSGSGLGIASINLIDEAGPSFSELFTLGNLISEGGIAWSSPTTAFWTNRGVAGNLVLSSLDLVSTTSAQVGVIPGAGDINALTLRSDGMLVGIDGFSNSLLQIDPLTAQATVIAVLAPEILALGGFVQTPEGTFFSNSAADGSENQLWSIDLFTGVHSLQANLGSTPAGISGLALPIPEPSTTLLLGLGLALLASRRSRPLVTAFGLLVLCLSPQIVFAGEIEDMLNKACEGGLLSEFECAELLACLNDPASCSSGESAMTATQEGGGGPAMMMGPVPGASLNLRGNNTFDPELSPNGNFIAFERQLSGIAEAVQGDFQGPISLGNSVPSPGGTTNPESLGGITDFEDVVGTARVIGGNDVGFIYLKTTQGSPSIPLTLQGVGQNPFDAGRVLDVSSDALTIFGQVFDDFPPFGAWSPAIWTFNASIPNWELRRIPGLAFGFEGTFLAATTDGLFGVGESSSSLATGTFGGQAFVHDVAANTSFPLDFLPGATSNDAEATGVSNSTALIAGNAINASGNKVAVAWAFDGDGSNPNPGPYESPVELDRLGETTSKAFVVSFDENAIGGSIGIDAAVWDIGSSLVVLLKDYVDISGLSVPPECTLSEITDFNEDATRIVGNATCNTGGSDFQRAFELELPFSVPEPGGTIGLMISSLFLVAIGRPRLVSR